ncbi:hypothetical protein [Psychrobacillus sp. BM2]|uniref:hypothetical protein n=1 Tax=Psychrobacillus sp. BM2 TaxID=3400421 RepID=UPI003B014466
MEKNTKNEYQMKGIYVFRYAKIAKSLNLDLKEIMSDVAKTLKQNSSSKTEDAVTEAKENPIGQVAVWGTLLAKLVEEVIQNIDAVEKDLVSFMGAVSGKTKKEIEELNPEEFMNIVHWLFSGDNLKAFTRAWEGLQK